MRINRLFILVILTAMTLVLGVSVLAQDTEPEDVAPIHQVWDEAFNIADVDQLMSFYAEDLISMPPGLPRREGQDALRADFEFIFETYDAYHETELIEMLVSDNTIVELTEYLVRLDPVDGGEEIVETGTQMMVRELIDGEWKIVWEIWNSDGRNSEE